MTKQLVIAADAQWARQLIAEQLLRRRLATFHLQDDRSQAAELGGSRLTVVPYLIWCLEGRGRWLAPDGKAFAVDPDTAVLCKARSFTNMLHTGPIRLFRLSVDPEGLIIGENHVSDASACVVRRGQVCLHQMQQAAEPFVLGLIERLCAAPSFETAAALLRVLAEELLRCLAAVQPALSLGEHRFRELRTFLQEHLEEDLSREQAAAHLACSPSYCSRLCRRYGGAAFQDILRDMRIRRAEQLLRHGKLSVAQVARHCGFSSGTYFAQVFRALRACSPREFRIRERQGSSPSSG